MAAQSHMPVKSTQCWGWGAGRVLYLLIIRKWDRKEAGPELCELLPHAGPTPQRVHSTSQTAPSVGNWGFHMRVCEWRHFIFYYDHLLMCVMCTHMCHGEWAESRAPLVGAGFSPFTVWALGTDLWSSGLASGAPTLWAIPTAVEHITYWNNNIFYRKFIMHVWVALYFNCTASGCGNLLFCIYSAGTLFLLFSFPMV